jgi:hypothetical protein
VQRSVRSLRRRYARRGARRLVSGFMLPPQRRMGLLYSLGVGVLCIPYLDAGAATD